MPLFVIEIAGVATGMAGSVLVAGITARRRLIGFILWICSNALLITWASQHQAWALGSMYVFYMATAVVGLRNNRRLLAAVPACSPAS